VAEKQPPCGVGRLRRAVLIARGGGPVKGEMRGAGLASRAASANALQPGAAGCMPRDERTGHKGL